jgi:hypothetical protein
VCVLDLHERRSGQQRLEELEHDLVQLRLTVVRSQLADLLRDRDSDVEGDREERKPREQPGLGSLDLRENRRGDDVVRIVPVEAEQLAQDVPPDDVRDGPSVVLADRVREA